VYLVSLAACVSNRAVKHHLATPANAQAERGMEAGLVEVHDRTPDRLDIVAAKPNRLRVDFRGTERRDFSRVEDADPLRPQTPYLPTPHACLLPN